MYRDHCYNLQEDRETGLNTDKCGLIIKEQCEARGKESHQEETPGIRGFGLK